MTETGFGELLRRYRVAAGLTQEQLAERSGLSTRGISDLERGARGLPRKDTLQLLLQALDLSPADRAALVAAARRPATSAPRQRQEGDFPTLPAPDDGSAEPPPPSTPLIGREAELAVLRSLLAETRAGRGGIALLEGEPGIGKTRTAEELAREAERGAARVLWGRCYHDEGAPAFWPWVQFVRAYADTTEPRALLADMGPGAVDIAQLVPEVSEQVRRPSSLPHLDPAQARFRLFESITTFLKNASRRTPLVLILDDMHWADEPSLLLLRFLAREVRQAHVLVVGTYRDVEVGQGHPLLPTLADLAREPGCRRIPLRGLSEHDVARIIEYAAGQPVPHQQVSAVYLETEGNPFFVAEVVRLLAAEGRLLDPQPLAPEHPLIPPNVREVICRRLDHLSPECGRVLSIAAFIGREFRLATLQQASDLSGDPLLEVLEEAVSARIISTVPGAVGRYSFEHALVRETLYEQLGPAGRARAHRRIGVALETLYGSVLEPHLAELAYHFCQGAPSGDVDRAIDYAVRAAERASAQLAYEEAVRHYRMALEILELRETPVEKQRGALLVALGEAESRAGDRQAAQATFRLAAEIGRRLDIPRLLAQAALGYGGPWVTMGVVDATLVELLEEALSALPVEEAAVRARGLARLAMELYFSPERERRASLSRQAVETARQSNDTEALAYVLGARCFALWGPDDVEDRLAAATELLRLAEQVRDDELALQGHLWRVGALLDLGALQVVRRELDVQARLAERLRQPVYLWQTAVRQVLLALVEGRFEEGERLARQALALGERAHPESALGSFGLQMLVLCREKGRLDEVEPLIREFAERYPAVPGWRAFLAHVYAELGRCAEAQNELARLAVDDFASLPRDLAWLGSMAILSEVCAVLGDVSRAATLYDLLLPYAERNVVAGRLSACLGPVARCLGLLAHTMERPDEAARYFEQALAMCQTMGTPPWTARTLYEYGTMLLAQGRSNEQSKAVELVGQALVAARALGMVHLEQQIVAVQSGEPGLGPRSTDRIGLTAREVEVLQLVAAGKTNREIAEALFVSPATVERHISNLYGKIGARGRADATAYALNHGLAKRSLS